MGDEDISEEADEIPDPDIDEFESNSDDLKDGLSII